MASALLNKKKEELLKQLKDIEIKQFNFIEQDMFKLKTNTAYIQNSKVFDGWVDFVEWIQTKHEQHWVGEVESDVEVTFKIKRKNKQDVKEVEDD